MQKDAISYAKHSRWDGIGGYLTLHEAYCLWVGNHFQVIIYTHDDEVIWDEGPAQPGFEPSTTQSRSNHATDWASEAGPQLSRADSTVATGIISTDHTRTTHKFNRLETLSSQSLFYFIAWLNIYTFYCLFFSNHSSVNKCSKTKQRWIINPVLWNGLIIHCVTCSLHTLKACIILGWYGVCIVHGRRISSGQLL